MALMRNRTRVLVAPGRPPARFVSSGFRALAGVSGVIRNFSLTKSLRVNFKSAEHGRDEVQRISLTGTSLTGTFTIGFRGQVSDPITYSATGSTLKSNVIGGLASLASRLGVSASCFITDVASVGANAATIYVRFTNPAPVAYQTTLNGGLGLQPIGTLLTVSITGLSGGSPAVTVDRGGTPGQAGARPNTLSLYTDVYADGYSSPITVGPRGFVTFSFGTGAAVGNSAAHSTINFATSDGTPARFPPYQSRLLGPWLLVEATGAGVFDAEGEVEFNNENFSLDAFNF